MKKLGFARGRPSVILILLVFITAFILLIGSGAMASSQPAEKGSSVGPIFVGEETIAPTTYLSFLIEHKRVDLVGQPVVASTDNTISGKVSRTEPVFATNIFGNDAGKFIISANTGTPFQPFVFVNDMIRTPEVVPLKYISGNANNADYYKTSIAGTLIVSLAPLDTIQRE